MSSMTKPRGFNERLRTARYRTSGLILQQIIKGEPGWSMRLNDPYRSWSGCSLPCQVDVSKSQGKPVSRKPVIHYAFEVFSNFLCKDRCEYRISRS